MSPLNLDDLKIRLKEEDSFITQLIDTIPPKVYFNRDVQEKILAEKHALMDETVKGLQGGFSGHKEASTKVKHKRAKLDPHCQKSVSQIQEKLAAEENKKAKKKVTFKSAVLTRAENIEELQRRLQEKVKELQAKRRGCSAQEFVERKRLKKEQKKLKRGKQKGNFLKDKTPSSALQNGTSQKPAKKKVNNKPMYNKDGKVIFSKLEFSEPGFEQKKDGQFSGKNYKKLLKNVEKEKEKVSKLKEQDEQKAEEFVHKNAWKRAIEKAEGVKVKDDPALLKKSLMKQEKRKRKSTKLWEEREEHAEKKKKMQQEKRQKNIQNRKKEKLQAKLKRAKKKGRIIPGF